MSIIEAFEQLLNTAAFKDIAKKRNDKEGSHYRMLKSRHRREILQAGAMVEVLLKHGYKISATK